MASDCKEDGIQGMAKDLGRIIETLSSKWTTCTIDQVVDNSYYFVPHAFKGADKSGDFNKAAGA